jgi:hypothetical protein
MIRRTVALFAMLMLAGCESPLFKTPPPPMGERLNAQQITAVLAGNSLVRSADEVPLTVYFAENGALHGMRSNHYKDSGTWKVEQDAVCGKWRNWFGTMSQCWAVYQADKMLTFKRTDHGDTFRAAIESGNVASLR